MYYLNLSTEEHQALIDVLRCSISELHSQIVHAERHEFKSALKDRKQVLLGLLDNLQEDSPAVQLP